MARTLTLEQYEWCYRDFLAAREPFAREIAELRRRELGPGFLVIGGRLELLPRTPSQTEQDLTEMMDEAGRAVLRAYGIEE